MRYKDFLLEILIQGSELVSWALLLTLLNGLVLDLLGDS